MRAWLGLVIGGLVFAAAAHAAETQDAEFFESKVRPLLIARCQECHGPQTVKAGLRLDSRTAILSGGESGPAAEAGKPDASLLMDVISYRNVVQMPPKAKLPDAEIAILTEWVKRGLPWPNSEPTTPPVTPGKPVEFTSAQKEFWAFQPVRHVLPVADPQRPPGASAIDDFLNAARRAGHVNAAPAADRRMLLRRATLDLTGLLPTPDEVTEFQTDPAPDAFERVLDRLLASPRYGERWGRHWLDVARYADSNGLDENLAYANAYHYRDYVIRAFQADKPYDRFLTEQIAGDLLPPEPAHEGTQEAFDPLIATGFLCLGAKMLAEDDPVKMQMDIIDEQVDTIARAVLGLTMGCARCHDHKFDPLTSEDYYGLAGIFKSTQTMDTFSVVARWHERPLATPAQLQQRDAVREQVTQQSRHVAELVKRGTDSTLTHARRQMGAYLLAATARRQRNQRLEAARPRGNVGDPGAIPGAILIEAEDFVRGNVARDRDSYGKGIGVLVNRGETPNFAEYDLQIPADATYQLELRYAAAASRPVRLFLDGKLQKADAAARVTGSWQPDSQSWFVEDIVPLTAGTHVVRLEQPQFFPHIDKLLLTPETGGSVIVVPDSAETTLVSSIVQQWVKALDATRDDSRSVLAPWHQMLNPQESSPAGPVAERLNQPEPPKSLVELAARYDQSGTEALAAWETLAASGADLKKATLTDPALDQLRKLLLDPQGPFAASADIESTFSAELAADIAAARSELKKREGAVPVFPEAMAVAEATPVNLRVHLRGNHTTLGKEVTRQFPRIFREVAAATADTVPLEGSGRRSLAQWLTDRTHPLTPRVMVNRVWQWHFGAGIVRSPDNFGLLGERPAHPDLLDWLARDFVRTEGDPRAWSLKSLHRRIMASTAYRQSPRFDADAAHIDPENRLLWRYPRRRMEVEALRDSLLALSGELDDRSGGTLLPTANRAYVTSTANVNPAIYDSLRRSVYLPVVRSALFEVFTAFDFADPSTLVGQRDQTTVAPQALFMMNSRFVLQRTRTLAGKLLAHPDLDDGQRIQRLYELAYSRPARDVELQRARSYLAALRADPLPDGMTSTDHELQAWASLCRAIVSANEFISVE